MLERKVFYFCIDVFPNWKQLQYSHTMSNLDKQETRSLYFLCTGWHRSTVLNFLLGKFEFEQFCLHANHFLLFACPLPPVTALFVNLSTQPTMWQQKGSSICLSVFLCFLFFFKQPILRAILLFLIAILTQQLLQRILHTCGNNFTFSRLKLYLRQSSSFNDSCAFCCQDEGKII